MVVVDYRGHRLTAMTLLPITRSSLVYGSADGGVTVCSTSPEIEQRMNLVGKIFNLAQHRIWDLEYSKYLDSCVPVDMEGHLGSDNRFYIADPARLLPPAVPTPGMKGSQLYRLLRPEFVKRSPVPLCSDAFGSWHIDNLEKYNEDIQQATLRLETQEIAKVFPFFFVFYQTNKAFKNSLFRWLRFLNTGGRPWYVKTLTLSLTLRNCE